MANARAAGGDSPTLVDEGDATGVRKSPGLAGTLWLAVWQFDLITPFPVTRVSAIVQRIALGAVAVAIVVGAIFRRPHPGGAADRE